MNTADDTRADTLRILDLASEPPPVPLARIESAALGAFDAASPARSGAGWMVWAGGIAAALLLAIAVPLMLDLAPAGPIAVEQATIPEPVDDADAFAAAMLGYGETTDPTDVDAAVEEVLEAL